MKIKKISIIVGTRPQIIKSQPILKELKKSNYNVELINTGQHYDYELSEKFFTDLHNLKPSINFGIGKGTHLEQIAKIILKLENYFRKRRPDLAIIPGDTTSALAGALACSKKGIKCAHLEAGARSNQFFMAEEINRRIIDHCSNFLFAPTKNCLRNLKKESVLGKSFFVGDTMYDLFLEYKKKYHLYSPEAISKEKQILVTIHRAENIENKPNLKKICSMINSLSRKSYKIIFPLHPHTKKKLKEFGFDIKAKIINPVGYSELMKILSNSTFVITDSGGLQKESYWMGKPCITLRERTEWKETVAEAANFLFPLSKPFKLQKINNISKLKIKPKSNLFGSGLASKRIVKIIDKL